MQAGCDSTYAQDLMEDQCWMTYISSNRVWTALIPMQFAPAGAATAPAAVPSSNATAAAAKPALPAKSAKPAKGVHPHVLTPVSAIHMILTINECPASICVL